MKRIIPILCLIMMVAAACKSGPKFKVKDQAKQEAIQSKSSSKFFEPALVSDNAQIFSKSEIERLERMIVYYEEQTTNEINIVTVDSIKPYEDMKQYSMDLFNDWKIGKAEKDNGLLIVINESQRKVRIATGYGTEEILTDEICKEAIDNYMTPAFKTGNYYKGVDNALGKLMKIWTVD